jgi:hypothetical protein
VNSREEWSDQVCQFHDEIMKKSPYPHHGSVVLYIEIPMLPSPKIFVFFNGIVKSVLTRCNIRVHEPTNDLQSTPCLDSGTCDGFFVSYDNVPSLFSRLNRNTFIHI